jgi:hypothetical protein
MKMTVRVTQVIRVLYKRIKRRIKILSLNKNRDLNLLKLSINIRKMTKRNYHRHPIIKNSKVPVNQDTKQKNNLNLIKQPQIKIRKI